jgi:O-antigen ligase
MTRLRAISSPLRRQGYFRVFSWAEIAGVILVSASAIIIASQIAYERWLYFLALTVLPFFFFWPVECSLGVLAFLLPFDNISAVGDRATGTTLTFFVGGVAAAVLLCGGIIHDRLRSPPRAALWWTLFFAYASSSAIWALVPRYAIERLPTAAALTTLYLSAACFRASKRELDRVTRMAVAGACVASLYAIHIFLGGITFSSRLSLIVGARETDPNQFAAALLLPLSLAIGELTSASRRVSQTLSAIAVLVITVAIFFTMSRGALVAVSVMVLIFLCRYGINWRIVITVVVLLSVLLLVPSMFFSRMETAEATRGAGRLDIWEAGIHTLSKYGVFGAGLDNFPAAYTEVAGLAPTFRGYTRAAHNIFLCIAVELGVVGLFLMLKAFSSQFYANASLRRTVPKSVSALTVPYEAACWSMLTAGFFLDNLWRKVFWVSWMLFAVAVQVARDSRSTM